MYRPVGSIKTMKRGEERDWLSMKALCHAHYVDSHTNIPFPNQITNLALEAQPAQKFASSREMMCAAYPSAHTIPYTLPPYYLSYFATSREMSSFMISLVPP